MFVCARMCVSGSAKAMRGCESIEGKLIKKGNHPFNETPFYDEGQQQQHHTVCVIHILREN